MERMLVKQVEIRHTGRMYGKTDRFAIAYIKGVQQGIREWRKTYEEDRILGNDPGGRTGQPTWRAHKACGETGGALRGQVPHH